VKTKDDEGSIYQDLTDWFYRSKPNEVFEKSVIAKKIKQIRQEWEHPKSYDDVFQRDVNSWLARVREDMEIRYRKTLRYIPKLGWKVATPHETALITAKWIKRTIMHADRTGRLFEITDRRLIPGAIRQVAEQSNGKIRAVSAIGKRYVKSFLGYSKEQALLQHKEVNENGKSAEKT